MVQDVSQPPKKAGLAVNTVDKSYILVGWASLPAYFYDYDLLFTKIIVSKNKIKIFSCMNHFMRL